MATLTFDKLAYVDRLKAAGVGEREARALAEGLDQALREEVATKTDLTAVKSELSADIAAVKTELAADIAAVKDSKLSSRHSGSQDRSLGRNRGGQDRCRSGQDGTRGGRS